MYRCLPPSWPMLRTLFCCVCSIWHWPRDPSISSTPSIPVNWSWFEVVERCRTFELPLKFLSDPQEFLGTHKGHTSGWDLSAPERVQLWEVGLFERFPASRPGDSHLASCPPTFGGAITVTPMSRSRSCHESPFTPLQWSLRGNTHNVTTYPNGVSIRPFRVS